MSSDKTLAEKYAEIRIRNRNGKLKRHLKNIAASEGMTLSNFCRRELIKVVATYPDTAKNYEDDGC